MRYPGGGVQPSRRRFPTVAGTIVRRTPLRLLFDPYRLQRRHYHLGERPDGLEGARTHHAAGHDHLADVGPADLGAEQVRVGAQHAADLAGGEVVVADGPWSFQGR